VPLTLSIGWVRVGFGDWQDGFNKQMKFVTFQIDHENTVTSDLHQEFGLTEMPP